jgi:hypothetical protein
VTSTTFLADLDDLQAGERRRVVLPGYDAVAAVESMRRGSVRLPVGVWRVEALADGRLMVSRLPSTREQLE